MKEFAAYVVSQCEKKKSGTRLLVEELAELWDISQSQTYKKMKGQTVISLEEACAAARKYQFSLDAFVFGPSDTVLVRYPAIGQPPRTPQRFLGELLHTMRAILKAKPSTRIRYATNEIPVFYYLLFPELTAFKMYIWSRSVWKSIDRNTKGMGWIEALLSNTEFRALSTETFNTFASIPTDEYYPLNMLDNTLKQITYYLSMQHISRDFADTLRQQMLSLTDWMARTAADGTKRDMAGYAAAAFELHHNEQLYTNNIVLVGTPGEGLLFCTLDNPNFMVTEDLRMVALMEEWFDSMRVGATKISGDGERAREDYFQSLRKRIG